MANILVMERPMKCCKSQQADTSDVSPIAGPVRRPAPRGSLDNSLTSLFQSSSSHDMTHASMQISSQGGLCVPCFPVPAPDLCIKTPARSHTLPAPFHQRLVFLSTRPSHSSRSSFFLICLGFVFMSCKLHGHTGNICSHTDAI